MLCILYKNYIYHYILSFLPFFTNVLIVNENTLTSFVFERIISDKQILLQLFYKLSNTSKLILDLI